MVEAKHSEVLKGTQATISCVVIGLTKKLDAVTWEIPSRSISITGNDGYQINKGTYDAESNSQTTILTIPAAENTDDSVYTCIITSLEHGSSVNQTNINSKIFSEIIKINTWVTC